MRATLTSKGQITLPKALRDELHLKAGDKIDFERMEDGTYVLRPKTMSIDSLKGFLKDKYKGPPVSVEKMQEAILKNAGRRNR